MPDPTNPGSSGEQPKLIIDSDWKSQAQAEKERLAAKEAEKAKSAKASGAASGPAGGPGGQPELPPADFNTLVGQMITNCLMYMGAFPDPQTGRAVVSLEYSRFHIDLLTVLAEKTRGNLTKEEETELEQAVAELRMRYVELSQAVAKVMAERAMGGGGAGGIGGIGGGAGLTFGG